MHQTRQTLILVVAAALLAGVAVATHYATKPTPLKDFEKVGTEFYAEFDPAQASSLRVVSYNADEASISEFEVERKNGLWRIPSHHNYPADAKDQLAKAAASLIGLSRESVASRQKSDHEQFGVISPESDDPSQITGLGQRITVTNESGKVLADLIIGKEVEDREGYYYVRRPDEKETYRSSLDIDLSTKFATWIEQDLLKMDRWNVVRLVMSKPDINEEGRIIDRERVELSRKDTAAQWQMAGLEEATEEVDRTAVDNLLRNIDELEIVGVRPKPAQIAADLRVEIPQEFRSSPTAMRRFAQLQLGNLAAHGFEIGFGTGDNLRVYSREGAELALGTNEGVLYHVHLGDVFTGTLQEIEIGGQSESAADGDDGGKAADGDPAESASDAAEPPSGNGGAESPASDDTEGEKSGGKLHRYVFVRAQFDPTLIGPEPTKPEEPPKPEELKDEAEASGEAAAAPDAPADEGTAPVDEPAADAPSAADASPDSDAEPEDGAEQPDAGQAGEESGTAEPAGEADQAKLRAEYDAALKQYEASLIEYERKQADYERKARAGQEKADELNRRFRDWYYVISGASLENLKIDGTELVKPRAADDAADGAAPPGPGLPGAGPESDGTPAEPATPENAPADEADPNAPDADSPDAAPDAAEAAEPPPTAPESSPAAPADGEGNPSTEEPSGGDEPASPAVP